MIDDVCKLVKEVVTVDDVGNERTERTERQVFCGIRSVSRSEFYDAARADLNPSIIFVIPNHADYAGEKIVEYRGQLYAVIRTYRRADSDELELTAEPKVGVTEQ